MTPTDAIWWGLAAIVWAVAGTVVWCLYLWCRWVYANYRKPDPQPVDESLAISPYQNPQWMRDENGHRTLQLPEGVRLGPNGFPYTPGES